MQRPTSPGTIGGLYTDGQPYDEQSSSIVGAAHLNSLSEETCNVIEATGRTLDPADNTQLLAAIRDLIGQTGRSRRSGRIQVLAGSTTLDSFGMGTLTIDGTPLYQDFVVGPHVKYSNTGAVDEEIGLRTAFTLLERRWSPDVEWFIQPGIVASTRQWYGLFSASPMTLSDPASIHAVGFRFEQGVDPGTWQSVTSNGTTSIVKDTGVAVVAGTSMRGRLRRISGSRFEFYINGQLVSVHDGAASEPVPAAATPLGIVLKARNTAAGAARDIRFGYCNFISD